MFIFKSMAPQIRERHCELWVTGVVTSITISHQWCQSFPFPFSTTNRYSPTLSCQDIKHTQEWGIMEKPFHHPSGVLWAAQPLAFRLCETVLHVGIGKKIPNWELGAATSWNSGKGTSPQARWFRALVAWLCQMEGAGVREGTWGKERSGGVAILQQIFIKEEQPQRKGQHKKGDADKAAWVFLHLPWISGCQLSCEDAQGVFQRFHLVSLEILPFKGKLVFAPVFQHCISTFTQIPTKTPQKQILGQS